jgi:hypothetical protein
MYQYQRKLSIINLVNLIELERNIFRKFKYKLMRFLIHSTE